MTYYRCTECGCVFTEEELETREYSQSCECWGYDVSEDIEEASCPNCGSQWIEEITEDDFLCGDWPDAEHSWEFDEDTGMWWDTDNYVYEDGTPVPET